jgi:hypothetical protein
MSVTIDVLSREQRRDEFQAFCYDVEIHEPKEFKTPKAFFEFLSVQHLHFPTSEYKLTLSNFIDKANAMANAIWKKCRHSLYLYDPC